MSTSRHMSGECKLREPPLSPCSCSREAACKQSQVERTAEVMYLCGFACMTRNVCDMCQPLHEALNLPMISDAVVNPNVCVGIQVPCMQDKL